MSKLEDIYTLERLLKEYNLPVSTILNHAIKQRIEEFSSYDVSADGMPQNEVKEENDFTDVKAQSKESVGACEPVKSTDSEITKDSEIQTKTDQTLGKKTTKGSRIFIQVTRPDKSVIRCKNAAATLAQTIKEIGAENVASVNISVDGMNLVNLGGNPLYPSAQYDVGNGFFVNTHSNTEAKARYLRQIFKTLNLDWKVEILEDSTEDDRPKE